MVGYTTNDQVCPLPMPDPKGDDADTNLLTGEIIIPLHA